MFERFTEKAIKVIILSNEEARRLGHNFICTEQILLGLIGEETGIAAKVLRSMGVNLNDARIEVEKIIGRGSGFVAKEIPFTPIAKRVLEFAEEESHELGHNYIGTEHLLLGLIREREGIAIKVLEILGVNVTTVPAQVKRMLGEVKEVSSGSQSSPITIQQLEIKLLLKSIETKTVAIDRAVDELKEDIAALRRLMT
ncbi:MAG: ATP-dependent Clp protease regulatory subunit [Cyanobacteriota bacterium]|jgi:ATP-dependent Clp protease ATP-binding subunit ClpC